MSVVCVFCNTECPLNIVSGMHPNSAVACAMCGAASEEWGQMPSEALCAQDVDEKVYWTIQYQKKFSEIWIVEVGATYLIEVNLYKQPSNNQSCSGYLSNDVYNNDHYRYLGDM